MPLALRFRWVWFSNVRLMLDVDVDVGRRLISIWLLSGDVHSSFYRQKTKRKGWPTENPPASFTFDIFVTSRSWIGRMWAKIELFTNTSANKDR